MNKDSININEILFRRIDAPEAFSLEQSIIGQVSRPQREPKSGLTWIKRLYAHQSMPVLVSTLYIALGIALYTTVGVKQGLGPAVNIKDATSTLLTNAESAELLELELQEIWLLQDEMVLL